MATAADESTCSGNLIGEPLDTLLISASSKNGISTKVSAIHIGFMAPRQYVHFCPPPTIRNDAIQERFTSEEEDWLECMSFMEEDLIWILKLPHHRFWSQVMYDENLHLCLESYLTHAPRNQDVSQLHVIEPIADSLKRIHKLVFLVFMRMSTYKESKRHHITPDGFGDIIYNNFLFDVPKIMDLCVLYGFQNSAILEKMVNNIFSTQPKYLKDMEETCQVIMMAFSSIEEELSSYTISMHALHDIIDYICDVGITLYAFLNIYSKACLLFHSIGITVRLSAFYEVVIPTIEGKIRDLNDDEETKGLQKEIERKISLSKTLLIRTFRNIVDYCFIKDILTEEVTKHSYNCDDASENVYLEKFLDMFVGRAEEKVFLHDYNLVFPFDEDIKLFNELGLKIDSERSSYIYASIYDVHPVAETLASSVNHGARPKIRTINDTPVQSFQSIATVLEESNRNLQNNDSAAEAANMYPPEELKLSSLIQYVCDIFPCGEGFIEKCLEHYDYDPEQVVEALLSDSLHHNLANMDREMKRDLHSERSYKPVKSTVLSDRKNIYDNDEFDVFNRTSVDMERIHKGKKNKTPSIYESASRDLTLKEITLAHGAKDLEDDLYDDEYDDTYDSAMVGLKEPALEGEPEKDEPPDEKSNESPERRGGPNPLDFCVNPELLRQRREERRQSQLESRGGRRGPPPSHNASQNRQHKDRNKSRVGNHNRRAQSDFKKSRGMLPS